MSFERKNIGAMQGYLSGEQPTDGSTIKLNTNENPYPPAPQIQEIVNSFQIEALRRYPPPTANGFRDLAAAIHDIDRDNIIATRGGDELIRLLITTFVDPGQAIGMTNPTYSLYPVLAQIQNCPVEKVELETDWSLPRNFAQRMNEAGCRLTLVVNPHAPTGKLLTTEQVSTLADELDSVLLMDEAYVDFVEPAADYNTLPLIHQHDNLVILRTLSKGYSLAGLRFGYGIASPSLISPMIAKTRDSYNLDLLSQLIAEAALTYRAHAMGNCAKIMADRETLAHELSNLGLDSSKTNTNFLLVTVPGRFPCDAATLYAELKKRGILVRYFAEKRLADKIRVTVGTPAENTRLLDAIATIVAESESDTQITP